MNAQPDEFERRLLPERQTAYSSPKGVAQARSRLEAARRARGVRQQDLAAAIGIGVATLKRLEAKRTGKTPVQLLARCALVLDVPLVALIDSEDLDWGLPWPAPSWEELKTLDVGWRTPRLPAR